MNETIDAYTELINEYAWVALRKVKKPSEYDFEDFVQEGIKILLHVQKNTYREDKKCSFKTFFTLCLRHHFGSLVSQSYKNKKMDNLKFRDKFQYDMSKILCSAFDIVSVKHILQDFTPDELLYTETIFLFMDTPIKFRRKLTRRALKISYERERELRNSIHDKILK